MIPQAYIREWSQSVPWNRSEQVEQDLVISRALVAIFSDAMLSKRLAFRGGTALHKLYLQPQPRYSEDIDLVQVEPSPIGDVLDRLREVLSFVGSANVSLGDLLATMRFRFESESEPVKKMKLKVETNSREHFTVLGYVRIPFAVDSQWFKGTTDIVTYSIEELLGTKLRALYQRRKGRDLFDIYRAMTGATVNPVNVLKSYFEYMKQSVSHVPTQKEYQANLDAKIEDEEFLGDTLGLLRPDEKYDHHAAYTLITKELIGKM